MTRVFARVSGRVQGVGFRASTCAEAVALGLVGWVRNTADGAVELEAQGEAGDVDALVAWLRAGGPLSARVDAVDVRPVATVLGASGFRIRP